MGRKATLQFTPNAVVEPADEIHERRGLTLAGRNECRPELMLRHSPFGEAGVDSRLAQRDLGRPGASASLRWRVPA